jgi:hypothetical protein
MRKLLISTFMLMAVTAFTIEKDSNDMTIYNKSARIEVKNPLGVFIEGSFLYWQPRQDGTELAVINDTSGYADIDHITRIGTKYKPAFKVAIGKNLTYDDSQLIAEYLWYYSKQKAKVATTDIFPLWTHIEVGSGTYPASGNANWKLRMNMINIKLQRQFFVGSRLILTPSFGLKGGWLNQNYTANYYTDLFWTTIHSYSKAKSDSWLLGPRLGADLAFTFPKGFRFIGSFYSSICYQYIQPRQEIYLTYLGDISKIRQDSGNITNIFEMNGGFSWGTYFPSNKYYIDFALTYDFHTYSEQNYMFYIVNTDANTSVASKYPLFLHGITFKTSFYF